MKLSKLPLLPFAVVLIITGSLIFYFENYKNNAILDAAAYLSIFIGWILLFTSIIKDTLIDGKKIRFSDDKFVSIRQGGIKIAAYAAVVAIIFANIYSLDKLTASRINNILKNQPTNTAIAVIDRIETRSSRNNKSYFAIFQYTANHKQFEHAWLEKRGEFVSGTEYLIKYSVEYPEMFEIENLFSPTSTLQTQGDPLIQK